MKQWDFIVTGAMPNGRLDTTRFEVRARTAAAAFKECVRLATQPIWYGRASLREVKLIGCS